MVGFEWSTYGMGPPAGLGGDGWCVRDALSDLFGWPVGDSEWLSFIEAPEPADMDRLVDHLGLEWYDPDYADHVSRLTERVDHPGISCWKLHALQMGHVIYQPHLRYERPLLQQYWPYKPERYRILVDVRQDPHPLWRGRAGIEIHGVREPTGR